MSVYLLDTHVWMWLVSESSRLAGGVRAELEEAAQARALRVSSISAWELGHLVAKRRIGLSLGVDEWIRRALAVPGIVEAPPGWKALLESTRLEDFHNRDPADRILIATTRTEGWTLVTADRAILRYAAAGAFKALSATAR
jgi:PIN domain nuclease of toxin-antitoxin system